MSKILVFGIAGIGAAAVTFADHENIFGNNPLKKWWWERIWPTTPTTALGRTGAKLMEQEWVIQKAKDQYNLEQRMLAAEKARQDRIVRESVKYRVTG